MLEENRRAVQRFARLCSLLKVFISMRRNPGAAENGAEDVLGFLNIAMKDLAAHACPHACP